MEAAGGNGAALPPLLGGLWALLGDPQGSGLSAGAAGPLPCIEIGKRDPEIGKVLAVVHQVQGKQDVMDSTLKTDCMWYNNIYQMRLVEEEFGKIRAMGQEAETKLKLEMVASINEELEQMHLGHRKRWLKRRVEKRRKINHLAIQKTEQDLNQMHKDSVKLTERILALQEQSLQKLSEMSSTLPALASFVMEHSNLKGCPWFKED